MWHCLPRAPHLGVLLPAARHWTWPPLPFLPWGSSNPAAATSFFSCILLPLASSNTETTISSPHAIQHHSHNLPVSRHSPPPLNSPQNKQAPTMSFKPVALFSSLRISPVHKVVGLWQGWKWLGLLVASPVLGKMGPQWRKNRRRGKNETS